LDLLCLKTTSDRLRDGLHLPRHVIEVFWFSTEQRPAIKSTFGMPNAQPPRVTMRPDTPALFLSKFIMLDPLLKI
jgi:hypothetical protein